MSEALQEFFAVTRTSVYHVRASDSARNGYPSVQKISVKSESKVDVGVYLRGGTRVAICDFLTVYVPEGGGLTSFEQRIEFVNMQYWGGRTSCIVGLFRTRDEAMACLAQSDLMCCDSRWEAETQEVVEAIGEEHPAFYVCHFPLMRLKFLKG